jgi:hypothetical protein
VAAEIAARIAERSEQFDALKSALETDKAELARIHDAPPASRPVGFFDRRPLAIIILLK